ncbi:hypothetical protein [Paenibacillus sabinae]|uniref:Uncharacterized protein n=1 Tax=Paenibacillus sabinae T27 TaxID=1268072 RepID=X4ZHL3_9BACL|nr:hypothetical protein [Paenibacillus sabinae]AHV99006.1 hypothetical protein PSAB_20575 [Paenibacillus sabinae T27]
MERTFGISFYRQPRLDRHFIVRYAHEQIAIPADFFFGALPDVDMCATTGFTTVTASQLLELGLGLPAGSVKYFRVFPADAADRSLYFAHLSGTKQNIVVSRAALAKTVGITGFADVGVTPALSTAQVYDVGFAVPTAEMEVAANDCAIPA